MGSAPVRNQEGYVVRRTMIGAAAGLLVLAGCSSGSAEPAQPPTQQDALTTATATAAPAPTPDDVEVTSEAPATSDEAEEPEADGPPEMPDVATEQTQEGATAFAIHYLEMVNYTGKHPTEGLLDPLGAEGCKSCDNHETAVSFGVQNGDYLLEDTFDIGEPNTIFTGDSGRVAVPVVQRAQDFYRDGEAIDRSSESAEATLVIRVQWDGGWTVSEITVEP